MKETQSPNESFDITNAQISVSARRNFFWFHRTSDLTLIIPNIEGGPTLLYQN